MEPGKLRPNVQTRHVINVTGAEMLCLTRKCCALRENAVTDAEVCYSKGFYIGRKAKILLK